VPNKAGPQDLTQQSALTLQRDKLTNSPLGSSVGSCSPVRSQRTSECDLTATTSLLHQRARSAAADTHICCFDSHLCIDTFVNLDILSL